MDPLTPDQLPVEQLVRAMDSGQLSARVLVARSLERAESLAQLGAIIAINPAAMEAAEALDAERAAGHLRGPLHGVPVLLKDNIDTADMPTTAGSLALAGAPLPRDAALSRRLRDAGLVILGKANLSEWANFRSTRSVSGWSSAGGQCRNPYALDRSPCGSSSGSAVAVSAGIAPLAVGTETNGSIICPSSTNGVVGIKPTLGMISRSGIAPIAHSQDTAGPIARTVAGAAALLSAMAGPDPADPATAGAPERPDYGEALATERLDGLRIGLGRGFMGFDDRVDALVERAAADLRALGAEVVELDFPPEGLVEAMDTASFEVLLTEFKADLDTYLSGRGGPVSSLAELVAWNREHAQEVMPWFGQELLERAIERGPLSDPAYLEALETMRRLSRDEGIDAALRGRELDAILAPSNAPAWVIDPINGDHYRGGSSSPAAIAGYPNLTVPAGQIAGLPIGISLSGTAWTEERLIGIAAAYERATHHRRAPALR